MGLEYKVGTWGWVDKWPLLVSNWAPGHPDSDSWTEQHDCGRMNNVGQFYNENCRKHLPYVCKAEFVDFIPSWSDVYENLGQPINCTEGWGDVIGTHCYKTYRFDQCSKKYGI